MSSPPAVSSSSAKVVVIGAGLAGLASAATLIQAGFEHVQVLEATSRPGGRISTTRPFGPDVIELGANWIHGQEGNPVFSLAERHGLLSQDSTTRGMCHPDSFTPRDYFFREDGTLLSHAGVERVCGLFSKITSRAFDNKLEERFRSKSFGQYLDEAFADSSLASSFEDAAKVFEWCKRSECTDVACSSLYEASALEQKEYTCLEGNFYNCLGPGGYRAVLDVLLKTLPPGALLCDRPVTCIRWGLETQSKGAGPFCPVKVLCEDGEEFEADHVVVTSSLGFLKERASALFEPTLPEDKMRAIESLGFGTVDKIFLRFDERFWPEDCAGIQLIWEEGPEDKTIYCKQSEGGAWRESWYKKICGFDVVARHPTVLCGWISGREAQHMETLQEQEVGQVCVRLLRSFTGWPVPEPTQVLFSTWWSSPYVKGSYTFIPCGVKGVREHQALAAPLPNSTVCTGKKPLQVLFAGEATHVNFYTTTHGAFVSGTREAQRIIDLYAKQN
ncbi:spermine oxidase [Anguilla anguilla]|uniref:spermine oxidase n=1 Tax=Anguilla anguilla TaxID=7936 RepID=UPI0015AE2FDE|nr:spermine oxidase [Anguilla anguilla]XP_035264454.1 spermine oxidase [Anguilla anguilla]XP_035264455.1 spermine oxidase [Anguilla anguilla]XP_035264456.1 spermine oxidase [Anguilla anguilla]